MKDVEVGVDFRLWEKRKKKYFIREPWWGKILKTKN